VLEGLLERAADEDLAAWSASPAATQRILARRRHGG
jgi:hypothetical protein